MKLSASLFFALLAISSTFSFSAEPEKPLFTVLFTAEAHGALFPCDCPLQPLGGVARRATLVQRYRERGPVVLIDAGGWAAGGLYDENSSGDSHDDELRTNLMAGAMRLMKYDAIAATDAETRSMQGAYASPGAETELVVPTRDGNLAVPVHFKTVERGERLWTPRAGGAKSDPKLLAPLIVISRQGEEQTTETASKLEKEALVINAGRKSSQREWWRVGKATVANFSFQAQRLGVAEVYPAAAGSGRQFDIRVRFEPLTDKIPADPAITSALAPLAETLQKKGKKRIEVEVWTMPECPACIQARPDLQKLAAELRGRVSFSVHFVVHKENGKLTSLHGERELYEAGIQAIIQKYYPERIWDWMEWRESNAGAPWEEGVKKLGLLKARIQGALRAKENETLLQADYALLGRRRVEGTPSLVIANRLYDGQIERLRLLGALCGLLDAPRPHACKDVPACFFDAQCRKRGFIGRCIDAGKPGARCDQSRPALNVPATVIVDRENVYDNHERIMEIMAGDLPGVDYTVLDISQPEAQELIARLKLTRLPAYVLDIKAKEEVDFAESIGKVCLEDAENKKLVLKPFAVGSHRLLNRQRQKGRVDLFVSRFSKNGQEALEAALQFVQTAGSNAPEIAIHDSLYWKESQGRQELAAGNGLPEIEEAVRALVIKKLYPDKFNAYLLERGKRRGSSYWDVPLKALGMDVEKIRTLSEKPGDDIMKPLYARADLLKSLESGGDIVLLAENCELVPIRSRKDLREVLERISPKKP
ncbi:MAG TPA: hypothetical protein VEK08_13570 [Planctomycetota bacterium]|nr:hypothetical protein [Planctomycetota bacterium]